MSEEKKDLFGQEEIKTPESISEERKISNEVPETSQETTLTTSPSTPLIEEKIPEVPVKHLIEVVEHGERHIQLIKKILTLCLKITNINDWVNFGGKPYLTASGCEKIARLFGISWKIVDCEKEVFDNKHYVYYFMGEFTMRDIKIMALGARSSQDEFFRVRYTKDGKKITLPVSEIDEGDVKKGAYTNCIARGIKQILGLGNITWGMLKEAGLPVEKITQIEFKKSK